MAQLSILRFPLQYNSVSGYIFFFFKRGLKSGAALKYAWLVSFRQSTSVFLSRCSCVRAHVWMVMNNQTLLGYLDFL